MIHISRVSVLVFITSGIGCSSVAPTAESRTGSEADPAVFQTFTGGAKRDARRLSGGNQGTNCALQENGTLYCWGANAYGEAGNGLTTTVSSPSSVSGAYSKVAVGGEFACALKNSGGLACWGTNTSGELALGTTTNHFTPQTVTSPPAFSDICAGQDFACGLVNGAIKCWGDGSYGAIGNGALSNETTITAGPSLTNVVQIACSGTTACALAESGTVSCWGDNSALQTGQASGANYDTPQALSSVTGATEIFGGAGYGFCYRSGAGGIYCWGYNGESQLGDSTTTNNATPQHISAFDGARDVSVGLTTICAVLSDGSAKCVGANETAGPGGGSWGEIGNGTFSDALTPATVSGSGDYTGIAGGAYGNCAITAAGGVVCWGTSEFGELGNGTSGATADSDTPVAVSTVAKVVATPVVASGGNHSCVLYGDGSVRCWGAGNDGQLGNGFTTQSNTPVNSGLTNATAVAAGQDHTCALLADGTVECWGYNSNGQLGNNSTANLTAPSSGNQVSGITNAVAIAAGHLHSCALLSDGTMQCWGQNTSGQLGNGSTTDAHTPVSVSATSLTHPVAMGLGYQHTCAVNSDGKTYCWGYNGSGEVSSSSLGSILSTPQVAWSTTTATSVAAGASHTCATTYAGAVYCWGYNGDGELGNGTTTNSTTPVSTGITGALGVSSSWDSTCATLSGGGLQCWGYGLNGELGNDHLTTSTSPVSVDSLISGYAESISTGNYHTCAARYDGKVLCWGHDISGELGDGATTDTGTPVTVTGIP